MSESVIKKIERIYGKDKAGATLEQTAAYLRTIGFNGLADLLIPKKEQA